LTENLNENKKLSSKKRKTESKIKKEIVDENAYLSYEDSSMMEDDVDKDPDWKKTPLYSRIQKLQVNLYNRNCLNYDECHIYLIDICLFLCHFCHTVFVRGKVLNSDFNESLYIHKFYIKRSI